MGTNCCAPYAPQPDIQKNKNIETLFRMPHRQEVQRLSTIQELASTVEEEGGFQFTQYEKKVEQINETKFIIRHITNRRNDVIVEMFIDEEDKKVEWDGLPRSLQVNMEKHFETVKKYPLVCLNMVLGEHVESQVGLRPHEEIANCVQEAISLKTTDPSVDYRKGRAIGLGCFGEVFLVTRREDQKKFAMKLVKNVQPNEKQLVINEASLIAFLDSEEIIQCVDLYYWKKQIFILLEFMDQGSLTEIVTKYDQNYSEEFCRYSLYKVALGLSKMHRNNVLHRDIKSDNILCSSTGEIKITDLGFSCFLSEQEEFRKTRNGTPNWVSPEIAQGIRYSKEIDVWSFGCLAHELATGMPPFSKIKDRKVLLDNIINTDVPEIPDNWSADFKDFVKKCLNRNPDERYTIDQLLFQHPFLLGIDVEASKNQWMADFQAFNNQK